MIFSNAIKSYCVLFSFTIITLIFSCKKGGEIVPIVTSNNSTNIMDSKSSSRVAGDGTADDGASGTDETDSTSSEDGDSGIIGGDDNEDDDTIIGGDDNEDDDAGAIVGDGGVGVGGGNDDGSDGGTGDAASDNN